MVFDIIDSLFERYTDIWEDVVNIESPTDCKAGVDAVGRYFCALANELGFDVEVCPQEISGDVICITMNGGAPCAPIALSAHMDTVHPVGSFGTPAAHRKEGRIYGPGVTDCKGGAVAAMLAMDALRQAGFDKRPVMLLLQSDEENGSRTSNKKTIEYICDKAKNCAAFLNLEGYSKGEGCIERKGIITFKFTVTGVEAHSSNCAEKGANAIVEAAHKIIELDRIKDSEGLTCNIGVIEGGSVVNTVPGKCVFYANVRFATAEQLASVRKTVREIAAKSVIRQCRCEVEETSFRVAMERVPRNLELLERMNGIYRECGLETLTPSKRKGGSDASDVTAYGIPCVDSLGVYGRYIHSPDEFAFTESLKESAKRIAAVIINY